MGSRLGAHKTVALPSSWRTPAVVVCPIRSLHLSRWCGGARNRAISIKMSLNMSRDTATSAIWEGNVAPVADNLGADLDQFLA